jgi:hypothetical protein
MVLVQRCHGRPKLPGLSASQGQQTTHVSRKVSHWSGPGPTGLRRAQGGHCYAKQLVPWWGAGAPVERARRGTVPDTGLGGVGSYSPRPDGNEFPSLTLHKISSPPPIDDRKKTPTLCHPDGLSPAVGHRQHQPTPQMLLTATQQHHAQLHTCHHAL